MLLADPQTNRRLLEHLVNFHEDAAAELLVIDIADQNAVAHAVEKLRALGSALPFPHQSAIRAASPLRELRPKAGRCRWRAIYAQAGDGFVILAVVPEAQVDRRGFDAGVARASKRLLEVTS